MRCYTGSLFYLKISFYNFLSAWLYYIPTSTYQVTSTPLLGYCVGHILITVHISYDTHAGKMLQETSFKFG